MNNTEKLLSLINWDSEALKECEKTEKDLFSHFRTRENPKYLFDEKSEFLNSKEVLEEAEKVMRHEIFGVTFNGEIDYLYNPTVETSRDNEWSWSLFRTIYWQPLSRAYQITKNEKYVKEFIKEMYQFLEKWPAEKYIEDDTFVLKQPFPGHAWRTIEAGIRVYTTWLPCFEIFRHSPSFTNEDMATFILALRDHARFLLTHYSNHERSSNWLSMEASALFQIGVMFPELLGSGEWKETGYKRVMHEILYCFSDRGVHMEKTPIYHMVASIAFSQAVKIAILNGIKVPSYAFTTLERAAEYLLSLIKPDLSTPMIGDADRVDLTTIRADSSIYEGMNLSFFPNDLNELRAYFLWMYELTGRKDFLWVSTLRKEGTEPKKKNYKYPDEGIFVLRTGWGEKDDYVLTHSSVLERGERSTHSHNDSAHAEISLLGEDILVDSGRYIYRSSVWRDWREYFCSALAHNTLFVDNHEMGKIPNVDRVRGVRVRLNKFGEENGVGIIDLEHNGYVYMDDSVFHRRSFFLLPSHRVLIIDYVDGEGAEEHDFCFSFNFDRGKVSVNNNTFDFESKKGTKFVVSTLSNKTFTNTLYEGSEDPKGGWISYAYPIRLPSFQVRSSYKGKAPFIFVTVVARNGDKAKININQEEVEVKFSDYNFKVESEGIINKWK